VTLPSEVGEIDLSIALAFGAELDDPAAWTLTDVSDRLNTQAVAITRGSADETGGIQPSSLAVELDNLDGNLTPDHPVSEWWPNVVTGTPLVCALDGGTTHVVLDGDPANHVSTPDHASLDITGDLWLAAEVALDDWHDFGLASWQTLIGKWEEAGNQRSYMLWIFGGFVGMSWSPDGTLTNSLSKSRRIVPVTAVGRMAVAAHIDVDNDASGNTVTIYVAPRLEGPWTQMGDPIVTAGTTSIFSGTAPLKIGPTDLGSTPDRLPFVGRGYRFEVRSGDMAGTLVAAPDFTAQPKGTSSFVDTAAVPKTWTLQGDAEISDVAVRFVGQVAEIGPSWPHGDLSGPDPEVQPGDARVHVNAAGITRRLTQGAKPLSSTLRRLVGSPSVADNVVAYWPLEDGRDSTSGASSIKGIPPMQVTTSVVDFAADASLAASAPLPSIPGGEVAKWAVRIPPAAGTQWRIDWFIYIETPHTSPAAFNTMAVFTSGRASLWTMGINDTIVSIAARDTAGNVLASTTFASDPRFFGTWVLWSLNITQDGGDVDWTLNLVPIPLGLAFGTSGTITTATLGSVTSIQRVVGSAPPDGVSFGHFIVSTGLGLGWLAGGDTAWVDETAAHRFYRLCREEQLPVAIVGDPTVPHLFRGDPARSEPMGPQLQRTLPELLAECATADRGIEFELRTRLGLGFRTRQSLYNQTPALVLDAGASEIDPPFAPTLDDQRLRNDVTAKRTDGSSATAIDEASIATRGLYDTSVELNVASDDQLAQQAAWLLHLWTWPGMRYPTITSELTIAPDRMPDWLEVTEGDLVRVVNLPPQHPTTAVEVLVEGSAETISPQRWTPEVNGQPAGPWVVGVLDGAGAPDTSLARLDTSGSELATGIDAVDMSLSVAITAGPLWTIAAGQFPLDIEIGGERMTVSAITGAASPQTFTISDRGVNGVHKSHAAAAPVAVADPFRLAL